MCKIDSGIVFRANRKTIEHSRTSWGNVSLTEVVVSTEHRGKTYTQTISREQLSEAFGRSFAKIVRGGA